MWSIKLRSLPLSQHHPPLSFPTPMVLTTVPASPSPLLPHPNGPYHCPSITLPSPSPPQWSLPLSQHHPPLSFPTPMVLTTVPASPSPLLPHPNGPYHCPSITLPSPSPPQWSLPLSQHHPPLSFPTPMVLTTVPASPSPLLPHPNGPYHCPSIPLPSPSPPQWSLPLSQHHPSLSFPTPMVLTTVPASPSPLLPHPNGPYHCPSITLPSPSPVPASPSPLLPHPNGPYHCPSITLPSPSPPQWSLPLSQHHPPLSFPTPMVLTTVPASPSPLLPHPNGPYHCPSITLPSPSPPQWHSLPLWQLQSQQYTGYPHRYL